MKKRNSYPLVSVIIPAYNAEKYIYETLKSVINQTYKNLEILVVNDGSQDRTKEIVKAIAQQDHRIKLLEQANSGVAAARNLAIAKSQGEFIAPIDADDIWYPENLEKQVQCFLNSDNNVGLVYSWSIDIDEQGLPTGCIRAANIEGNVYKTLICHNFIGNASASLIRRSYLEKVGGYNCKLKEQNAQGCEDWELYLRIAEHYQFRVVPEFFIGYRKIIDSMSRDFRRMAKSHSLMLQEVKQKHPEIPSFLYRLSSSSFYMYLAHQSHQCHQYRNTILWLIQALRKDCITPVFRYGLYTLAIKSILGKLSKSYIFLNRREKIINNLNKKNNLKNSVPTLSQVSLKFKLLVGNVLHISLQLMSI
ncbi:glycosyl transferase family 2 [Nostoc sp. NIES-3756]|uniref:glycosyltransferase family 2 protein n=1 Tax=Nostoc sp. NIES-3756 TaxID=1751286 RepID=UPI000720A369|nr:glycosyltransferase family 2 protein [Nostoc sp. NIES-3756]BAT55521.1 glycosyl transferase family 2 [Nostoc sp. NIES-3756]